MGIGSVGGWGTNAGVGGVGGWGRNLAPPSPHTLHTPHTPPSSHLPVTLNVNRSLSDNFPHLTSS
ncbi:MAG: hypothetical protein V7K47_15785 [Nostoc sp.]